VQKCAASVVSRKGAVGIYVSFFTSAIKWLTLRHSEQHNVVKVNVVSALIALKHIVGKIFERQR
jgi:hypothetical protein